MAALFSAYTYGAAFLLSLFLPSVPLEAAAARPKLRAFWATLFQDRRFLLFLLGAALLAESKQTITVFLNQLQYLRSGIPPVAMGICTILVTLSSLLAAQSHRLAGRLGERCSAILLFGTGGMACILMALFAQPILSVAGMMALSAAGALFIPLRMDIQNRHISVANRATALSVHSFVMNLTATGTNLAFGALADHSVIPALFLGAAFCFFGLFLCFRGKVLAKHPGI